MKYITCSCGKRWPVNAPHRQSPRSCPDCGTRLLDTPQAIPASPSGADAPPTGSPWQTAVAVAILAACVAGFLLLNRLLGPPAASDLVRILESDPSTQRRVEAVRKLGAKNDALARRALLKGLLDSKAEVREAAATLLNAKDGATAVASLLEAYDKFVPGRAAIVRALAKFSDPAATSGLITRLQQESDPKAAVQLIQALDGRSDERLAATLLAWLKQSDAAPNALRVLAQLRDPKTVPQIADVMQDPALRGLALNALSKMADDGAMSIIREQLTRPDQSYEQGQELLGALGESNNPRLVPLLLDSEGAASFRYFRVLDRIDPDWVHHPKAQALLAQLNSSLRGESGANYNSWSAAQMMGEFGSPAFEILMANLQDKSSPTRYDCAGALARLAKTSREGEKSPRQLDAKRLDELQALWTRSIREEDWAILGGGWSECYKLPGGEAAVALALDRLGNSSIAVGFLESDSAVLHKAGTAWAEKNGYSIQIIRPMPGESLEQAKERLRQTNKALNVAPPRFLGDQPAAPSVRP